MAGGRKSPKAKAAGATKRAPRKKKLPKGMSLEEVIRQRAYEIWEAGEGGADPVEDWLRAEREVRERYSTA